MASRRAAASAVFVPYVLSRVLVLASLVVTRHVFTALEHPVPPSARDGLLGWDAAWYADIARGGYDAVDRTGLRFFPMVPLLGRAVGWLPFVDSDLGLLLVVNVSALVAGYLLWRLVWREREDVDLARRAVWIAFLAPSAFVLVMGYAEATLMVFSTLALLGLRSRRWWVAAAAGFAAGLTRPVGVILAVPALVEVCRDRYRLSRAEIAGRVAAVIAPGVGAFSYLLWAHANGNGKGILYPIRVHGASNLRGEWVDPVRGVAHAVREAFSGDHLTAALHVVTVLILLGLLVVLSRRWPASYTAYAAVTLLIGLCTRNLDSIERYSYATVPFVIAAADLVWDEPRERLLLVVLGAALVGASVLSFAGVVVP